MNRKKIIMYYIQTWFFLDILASFPYDWTLNRIQNKDVSVIVAHFELQFSGTKVLTLVRTLRYLKIMRLLRVVKVDGLLVHVKHSKFIKI